MVTTKQFIMMFPERLTIVLIIMISIIGTKDCCLQIDKTKVKFFSYSFYRFNIYFLYVIPAIFRK